MTDPTNLRLTAIDALRRGVLSLRANWELVLVQWVGLFVVVILFLVGLVPLFIGLGLSWPDLGTSAARDPAAAGAALEELVRQLSQWNRPALWVGLAGAFLLWTAAMVVQCFLTGGVYGILSSADRQAPPGPPRGWVWFRTFGWADFAGWGGRFLGRYFWFYNLYFFVVSLLALGFALLIVFAVGAGQAWGAAAGFGLGCGGFLPLFFVAVVTGLWFQIGCADLAAPDSTIRASSRRALGVLGRRLGAVLLLLLLAICASLASSMLFLPLSFAGSAFSDSPMGSLVVQGPVTVLQWILSSLVQLVLAASLVALTRSERS